MKKGLSIILVISLLMSFNASAFAAAVEEIEPRYAVGDPTIASVSPTSSNLVAGEDATVKVVIRFTPSQMIDSLDCTVKVYYRYGSASGELGSAEVIVNGTENVYIPVVFPIVGNIQIYAELYCEGTLVDTSSNYAVNVMGRWRIEIVLPTNRYYEGVLTLYDGNGQVLLQARCLGRSTSNAAMDVTGGNTPVGDFDGWLAGPDSNTAAYGPHKVVYLDPDVPNGRTNICIHGGRNDSPTATDYELRATDGCVRVTNGHQKQIEDIITGLIDTGYYYQVGRVHIREI